MKRKLSQLSLGLATAAVLLAGAPVQAAELGYLGSASGGAVRDPFGDCLRSAGGDQIPECMPEMAAEPPPPPPAPEPQVMMVSLAADANFDFDKSELKPAGKATLSQLAADMQPLDVRSVDIVGHTDSIGTEAYNQRLSERRAQSAADYLVSEGVNPSVITTRGMGETQPIAPNRNPDGSDNPEGRAKNRRVDITVDAQQM